MSAKTEEWCEVTTENLIREVGSRTDLTPYECAGVVSRVKGSEVRPQMLYQYVNKGYIPSSVGFRNTSQGPREVKVIGREDFLRWSLGYLVKNS